MLAAAVFGMIFNWWLYGGQYPEAFKKTGFLAPYVGFDGFNEVYVALVAAGAGAMMWLLKRKQPSLKFMLFSFAAVSMIASIVAHTAGLPQGPLVSIINHCGSVRITAWALIMGLAGAGLANLRKDDGGLVISLILVALALSRLPFSYERYMWFSTVPVMAVMVRDSDKYCTRGNFAFVLCSFLSAVIFCFVGSL